ncbi:MAG: sortase A [Candidatus Azotimanducaceae bacterium]|jgi:sortase A
MRLKILNKYKLILGVSLFILTAFCWGNTGYIHMKANVAQLLIEDAWRHTLEGNPHPPWSWADIQPVAKLQYTKSDKALFVLSGGHGTALAFGPGHIDGTSLPGSIGTSVIAGHRDTHFEFLENVAVGEIIKIQILNGSWSEFVISEIKIKDTRISNTWSIDPDLNRLILVTCFPFKEIDPDGPLRMVVTLEKLDLKRELITSIAFSERIL